MAKLTLAQRVARIPTKHQSDCLYMHVMRVSSDLAIANRNGTQARREMMAYAAHAINALRRAEKAAGLSAHA